MTRVFVNLPALPDRVAVVAECERIGALRGSGYWAHDGLRCMAEVPEVAMERVEAEALAIERRAEKLERIAEEIKP